MDFHALFQIIQKHPLYKNHGDSIRQQILSSRTSEGLCWAELSRRWKEFFPELYAFLETQRSNYKEISWQNKKLRQQGCGLVSLADKIYPRAFYQMEEPPLCLSYVGHLQWGTEPALAVVGSREPREESLLWMETELSPFLAQKKSVIVSGGARGIDQKAHMLAIRHGTPTVVVLPSGLGQIYPSSLQSWRKNILETGGCLISEYDFNQKMQKFLFHHRNRLIAALGNLTLVVEARQRSGTLITAQLSARWGRPVLVVPGHPSDNHFRGGLDLLAEGAELVRDAQDLALIYEAELWSTKGRGVSIGNTESEGTICSGG